MSLRWFAFAVDQTGFRVIHRRMFIRPVTEPEEKHSRAHHASNAVNDERQPPAIDGCRGNAGCQNGGNSRTQTPTHCNQTAGSTTFTYWDPSLDHARGKWIGTCLEHAATQSQQQQSSKAAGHAHQPCASRPQKEIGGEHDARPVPVSQPASGNLKKGIGPEERGQ